MLQVPSKYKKAKVEVISRKGSTPFWVANWRLAEISEPKPASWYKDNIIIWLQKLVINAIKEHNNKELLDYLLEHEYREANIAIDLAEQEWIKANLGDNVRHVAFTRFAYALLRQAHDKVVREMWGSAAKHVAWSKDQLRSIGLGDELESNNRDDILSSLVDSVSPDYYHQMGEAGFMQAAIDLAKKVAPTVALVAPTLLALRNKKMPSSVNPGQVTAYAKKLIQARNDEQAVAAVAGLLHICAKTLLGVSELRELGHRINGVLFNPILADYLE